MITAYMFPGLNGLLRHSDRLRFSALPETQVRLRRAEEVLQSRCGLVMSLDEFLAQETSVIYSVSNISIAAVAICCLQMGIVDSLSKLGHEPHWLIGCSLGDLARSITAESYSFEDAIANHVKFTKKIGGIDKIGGNIGVATKINTVFLDSDFKWFEDLGADVSRLTPRFLNIGAKFEQLALIQEQAKLRGWATMSILEYPAHSRYILPFVEAVRADFESVKISDPQIPMFSSLSCRQLSDPDIIREEFLLSITKTIHWHKAIEKLVSHHGVGRFINIGPCTSLSRMMRDIEVDVEVVEASRLLC